MSSKIRIVDIANLAGVSTGTVDRILHQRGNVAEDKRKRVEAVLRQVEYKPNLLARSLASKRSYTIAALIPEHNEDDYWHDVRIGIERAASENREYNIDLKIILFDQYNQSSFLGAFSNLKDIEYDAVIITPMFQGFTEKITDTLTEYKKPYCYIDSNSQSGEPIAFFGANSYSSGCLAAQLICDKAPGSDVVIGYVSRSTELDFSQQSNRMNGFVKHFTKNSSGKINKLELKIGDDIGNSAKVEALLRENPKIRAGVVFNSSITLLVEAIRQSSSSDFTIVGYDLTARNREYLRQGDISYLIGQRPHQQGFRAFSTLANHLIGREHDKGVNYMPIDIFLKENIDYYQII